MSIILKVMMWIAIITVLFIFLVFYGITELIENIVNFEVASASVNNGTVYITTTSPNVKIGQVPTNTKFNIQRQTVTTGPNSTNTSYAPVLEGTVSTITANPHGGWTLTGNTTTTTYKYHHSDIVSLLL